MYTSHKLQKTNHFQQRLSQRGIKQAFVDLTLKYGKTDGDKIILDKKACKKALECVETEERALKQIYSRGGYVVVKDDSTLITAYRKNSYSNNLAKNKKTFQINKD